MRLCVERTGRLTRRAVPPHQAAGALSAIEDAEALGAFLRGVDRNGVHNALRRVFRVRYRRTSEIQAASRRESLTGTPGGQLETYDYVGAEKWEREKPDMVLGPEEVVST
jgi:2-polyprenyl-6-methoxyphenol hydroxylase-like FAD-dependent oxidoreductase